MCYGEKSPRAVGDRVEYETKNSLAPCAGTVGVGEQGAVQWSVLGGTDAPGQSSFSYHGPSIQSAFMASCVTQTY